MLFAYNGAATPYLIFVGIFLHNIFAALWTVTSPAMTADYCEYQQWKTGDRLDGYMSQYTQVFTTVCGMFTGLLVSEILIKIGAKDSVSYENPEVMRNVFIMWAVLGAISGILAMIPFLFWDLTEKRQLEMTKELKIRALQNKIQEKDLSREDAEQALELGIVTEDQLAELGFAAVTAQDADDLSEAAADVTNGND